MGRNVPAARPSSKTSASSPATFSPIRESSEPTAAPSCDPLSCVGQSQAEEGRTVVELFEYAGHEDLESVHGIGTRPPGFGDGLEQLVVHALEAGPQQLVPVGEIDVDRRAGDAGFRRDLVHGHLGGTPFAEQAAGDVDDLITAEVTDDLFEVVGRTRSHLRP